MHKPTAKRLASAAGIPVLPDITLRSPNEFGDPVQVAEKCFAELGFPVILKPASEGGSVGMSISREIAALAQRIEEINKIGEQSGEWLIEPFVNGRAVTCGVIERGGNPMALPRWRQFLLLRSSMIMPLNAIPPAMYTTARQICRARD
jgi:D-alanine-D-alanine ligase